jgi:adenylate cyclase
VYFHAQVCNQAHGNVYKRLSRKLKYANDKGEKESFSEHMNDEIATLAVLFADIADSAQLYEKLGDQTAQHIIHECLTSLESVTCSYRGQVIKTIGDEVMSIFPDATAAVTAGKIMHQMVEMLDVKGVYGLEALNLHIGVHLGPIIRSRGDVFGSTVNIAARIAKMAKQRQILISEQVYRDLSAALKLTTQPISSTVIKGKSGEFKVYENFWELDEGTLNLDTAGSKRFNAALAYRLELKHCRRMFEVSQACPRLNLGRQSYNDLVFTSKSVSRSHAVLELRRRQYILTDQSTNGTYIYIPGKETFKLRMGEIALEKDGVLCLGENAGPYASEAVQFKVFNR